MKSNDRAIKQWYLLGILNGGVRTVLIKLNPGSVPDAFTIHHAVYN